MIFNFITSQESFFDSHLIDLASATNIKIRLINEKNKNAFINVMIKKWLQANFKITSLWEQFRDNFEDWTKNDFKSETEMFNKSLRKLKIVLRRRNVWVLKDKRSSLQNFCIKTLQEKKSIEWTEEKIRRFMMSKQFIFNIIKNLIETDFDRNSKNYS